MTNAKAQLVRSWLTKAQRDLASARVLAASDPPLLDTAIYHCQQAAEKAVKGYLVFCDQEFERVHDIELLIRAAMSYAPEFADWIDVGIELTPYVRIYRYLDMPPSQVESSLTRRWLQRKGCTSLSFRCCRQKCGPNDY